MIFNHSHKKIAIVLIFGLSLVVYVNSLGNQFTNWDDDSLIVNNEQIRSLDIDNIKNIFDIKNKGTYQPVRVLSYAIDYFFFKLNPVGYHIQNILLHSAASVFLYLSLNLMIPRICNSMKYTKGSAAFVAIFTTILFMLHPINCEAVVWLSGRKYVLLSFFSFLSLYLYTKGSTSESYKTVWIAGSGLCVILAALSSPFGIILPAIFFVFDYSTEKMLNPFKIVKKNFKRYLCFLIPGILVFIKLWSVLAATGTGKTVTGHFGEDPLLTLWTMLRVIFDYFKNLLFPFWLNNRYPDYISFSPFNYKILVAMAGIGLILFVIIRQLKHGDKTLFFSFSWFFLFWLPVSNIIPISTKMADRYIYMASVGIYLCAGFYISFLIGFYNDIIGERIKIAVLLLLILYCGFFTVNRNLVWMDSGSLWTDSLKKDKNNFMAYNNLGVHNQYVEKNLEKAIQNYKQAILIEPEVYQPYENITACFLDLEKYAYALNSSKKWLSFQPNSAEANYQIGLALEGLGRNGEAAEYYRKAVSIDLNHSRALNNLGNFYLSQKEFLKAEEIFKKVIISEPRNVTALFNLGVVCSLLKKPDCSSNHFKKVVSIAPTDVVAHFLLGKELIKMGKILEGKTHIKEAIQIAPQRKEFKEGYEIIKK